MNGIQEIGSMLRHPAAGHKIKDALKYLPNVAMECAVTPVTRTVLRVVLRLRPDFTWRDSAHGHGMRWVLWVGDSDNDFIYYNEVWTLTKKMMQVMLPQIFSLRSCRLSQMFVASSCCCSRSSCPVADAPSNGTLKCAGE